MEIAFNVVSWKMAWCCGNPEKVRSFGGKCIDRLRWPGIHLVSPSLPQLCVVSLLMVFWPSSCSLTPLCIWNTWFLEEHSHIYYLYLFGSYSTILEIWDHLYLNFGPFKSVSLSNRELHSDAPSPIVCSRWPPSGWLACTFYLCWSAFTLIPLLFCPGMHCVL